MMPVHVTLEPCHQGGGGIFVVWLNPTRPYYVTLDNISSKMKHRSLAGAPVMLNYLISRWPKMAWQGYLVQLKGPSEDPELTRRPSPQEHELEARLG